MATTTTATTNFSSTVVALIRRNLEEELRARLVYLTPGSFLPAEHVKGTNGVMRFVAYADLAAQTTTLTEGTAPTDQALAIASDSFTAAQKGGTIAVSDLAQKQSPHDLIVVAADRAARQAAVTMDEIARIAWTAGTNIVYSNGSARSAVSAILTGALTKRWVGRMEEANVPRFPDGFYRAIVHPRQAFDLFTDTANGGWMDASKYVDNLPLLQGELGAYHGVRFLISSRATIFATAGASAVDVIQGSLFGPGALAWGDPGSLEAYFTPPGGDHSDPIAQKAIIGWKAYIGGVIAGAAGNKYTHFETAATVLSTGA